jgi:alanyl-tRNA synthetase
MGDYYPEIIEYSSLAAQIISEEEEKFHNSIGKNLSLIHQVISSSQGSVQGSDAFFLYDTKGVPLELLTEIALDYGLEIDLENFNKLMTQQRSQSSKKIPKILHNVMHQKSVFYGYDKNDCQGMILGIYKILELEITGNDYDETYNAVVLDNTVFYPRGGGQVGDSGFLLRNGEKIFFVYEAIKVNENIYHIGSFLQKNVNIGDCVHCEIDLTKRNAITKNHTATHLLHAAIMLLFGKNSVQRGSLVNEMKLRFDFHCESNVTKEHIMKLEDIVNTWIIEQHPCVVQHLSLDEAQKQRVILLDCASYNEEIRILKIGNPDIISQEACGGTHVSNSGMIGSFGILDCKTIAKDTRRIEAVTGWNYHKVYQNMFSITQQVRDLFKTNIENLFDKADKTIQELNEAKNYLQKYEEGLFLLQTKPENINVLIENYHNIALKYVVLNYLRAPFFKYIQQQDKNINSLLLYLLLDSKNTVKNIYWFSSHSSATSLANYLQQITSENVEIKGNMFQLNLTRKVQCNNLLDIIKQAK